MPLSPYRRSAGTGVVAAGGLALSVPDLGRHLHLLGGADATAAFSAVVALALAVLSLWLLLASTLVAVATRTGAGTRLARHVAPAWLAASLSTSALLLVPAAHAAPPDLDGLPLPDRVPVVAAAHAPAHEAGPPPALGTVVVRSGDCLWDLAREHAGAATSPLDLARLVAAWHDTNRTVIGPDPDVLRPGQVLTMPFQDGVAP